jgi:hypothetical protein
MFISGFTAIAGAVTGAGGVIALLSNPIGWVILGIGALIAVVALLWDDLKPLRDAFMDLAGTLWDELKPVLGTLGGVFSTLWSVLKKVFIILQPLFVLWLKINKVLGAPVIWVLVKAFQLLAFVLDGVLKDLDAMLGTIIDMASAVGKFFGITTGGAADLNNELRSDEGMGDFPIGRSIGGFDVPQGLSTGGVDQLGPLRPGTEETRIKMDFGNLPDGARVTQESGGNVDINVSNGVMRAGY